MEVSVPLTSVRQALNSLFDECRVKTDAINKMIKNAISNKQKHQFAVREQQQIHQQSHAKNRREIWYKPSTVKNDSIETNKDSESESSNDDDGESDEGESSSSLLQIHKETGADSSEAETMIVNEKKLSTNELNKRFMLNYLNTIGKLFTKVGMETYQDVCSHMLHELDELLKRRPCPLGKMRLVQINAINIAVIDLIWKSSQQQQQMVHGGKGDQSFVIVRSQQLECAIQLGLDVFALLAKRYILLEFISIK